MATYTPNYNLKKPSGTEDINVNDINGNMDIIDTAIKGRIASIQVQGVTTSGGSISTGLVNKTIVGVRIESNSAQYAYLISYSENSVPWITVKNVNTLAPIANTQLSMYVYYIDA